MSEPPMAPGLREIEEWWSMRDVLEAHEVLDWKEKYIASETAKRKMEQESAQRRRGK